jgi:transposase
MRELTIKFSNHALEELDLFLKQTKDVRVFRRAQAVREVVSGHRIQTVSNSLHFSYSSIRKWVYRFANHGIDGLYDQPRIGRPRKVTPEIEDLVWRLSRDASIGINHLKVDKSYETLSRLVKQRTDILLSRESVRTISLSRNKKSITLSA